MSRVALARPIAAVRQFMMNYGNECGGDVDLILSYVGTQIWGDTEKDHVLLLTSRKSCLMTSRGKLSAARAHNRTGGE